MPYLLRLNGPPSFAALGSRARHDHSRIFTLGRVVAQIDGGIWPSRHLLRDQQVRACQSWHDLRGIDGGVHLCSSAASSPGQGCVKTLRGRVQIALELAGEFVWPGKLDAVADPDCQRLEPIWHPARYTRCYDRRCLARAASV